MTNIRRYFHANKPIFITAVCRQRRPFLAGDEAKSRLLAVMRELKRDLPYRMLGYAVMDDHFHWLITPAEADAFPKLMQSLKLRFARRHPAAGDGHVWQRRYWDHVVRDGRDLANHLDYIHYNPVKHRRARRSADYRWSSFLGHVERGRYPLDWGAAAPPRHIADWELE